MHSFALLIGHLIGDYIFQRDWEARLKTIQPPEGLRPDITESPMWAPVTSEDIKAREAWDQQEKDAKVAPWACTYHCAVYTLAVFLSCFWFLPWWSYPVIFVTHWPVDRWRLARKFMDWNGQQKFSTEALSPWSIVVVDNIFHLVVLYVLGLIAVL